jgi:4-amino-4-deoxy-L-arabinose transferase-like glycosyltransferase
VGRLWDKKVFFLIAFASLALLVTGITSELYVGDEVYHYRFAKQIYETGRRVSYDLLYESGMPPGYLYRTEPLWEGGLAAIWKLFGGISFPLAQVYHTCFYALLLIFTYLVGKEIFGEREGLWSCLLMASMPMAIAFGVLFYTDLPATAMTMMALYLVIRNRRWPFGQKYLWIGLSFAAMYLTKRSTIVIIPAMIAVPLYFEKEVFLKKARNLIILLVPLFAIALWDLQWRYQYIDSAKLYIPQVGYIKDLTTLEYVLHRLGKMIGGTKEHLNSSLTNPLDLIKYLGIVVLALLIFYLIKRLYRKEKIEMKALIWGMIGSYFLFFLSMFGLNSDIRYLFPIVPLFGLLASKAITTVRKQWIPLLIIGFCLIQFGSTLFYVHEQRRIPGEIKQGFSYIRTSLPQESLFMYPEYIFLEATGRKFVWQSFFDLECYILAHRYPNWQGKMEYRFFWNTNNEDLMSSLRINAVDYIVIKKSKVYDDTNSKHLGGYPQSFVQRMPKLPFLKCIFENSGISIWEVQKDVLHHNARGLC